MRFQLSIIIIVGMICAITTQSTSIYKGVTWHKLGKKWYAQLWIKGEKTKYGGYFNDELDAAKRVNQLCEEFGYPAQNPGISAIPNQQSQKKQKTSQYKGVCLNKKTGKWCVQLAVKGEKKRTGGYFNDELQLCEELGIPTQNPGISAIPNQKKCKKNEKTSQYKGVYLNKKTGKWYVQLQVKGEKKNGGYLNDELDAAKRANQLCEEFGIPAQNPGISAIPNQQSQKKQKTSQYKGVSFNKKTGKWRVQLPIKGEKTRAGGYFNDELDAAKKVNQLCEELGIPTENPAISAIPNQKKCEKKEKISQYKGVYLNKKTGKWYVQLQVKGEKTHGGYFNDELDAAKKVNKLCEELGIPAKNPGIVEMPTQLTNHGDYPQTFANPVVSSEILKINTDEEKKTKRKRKTELNDDNELPSQQKYYFYEHLLN